ncbi:MAG: hypothetical protein IJ091_05015 [Oscillospiraceae bacterium]|nr:hypothetical protein [Oscillospiraceae bacterium]
MSKKKGYAKSKVYYCQECGAPMILPACKGEFLMRCFDCGQYYIFDVTDENGINGGFTAEAYVPQPPKHIDYGGGKAV